MGTFTLDIEHESARRLRSIGLQASLACFQRPTAVEGQEAAARHDGKRSRVPEHLYAELQMEKAAPWIPKLAKL